MVDEDIVHAETVMDASSYDSEEMEHLFHQLLERYKDKIEGFSRGLQIQQSYEAPADRAEIYRENIGLLLERLQGFRENAYSNEGLREYYIRRDWQEMHLDMDFTTVRLEIGMLDLPMAEMEEIAQHLNEMEEICCRMAAQKDKWEGLRQHLLWLSGKDVSVAIRILPLFFRIHAKEGICDV